MGDLLSLLIVIGIAGLSVWRKQQKQARQAAKNASKTRAFSDAAEAERSGRPVRREMPEGFNLPVHEAPRPEKPLDINLVEKYLEQALKSDGKTLPDAPKAEMQPAQPIVKQAQPLLKPAVKAARQAAPVLLIDHDDAPEGSISTQGESPEEHARHRQRILAEEAQRRAEHETLQEVRHMNLQKLRTAVVVSEILDKPVSLRRRRPY